MYEVYVRPYPTPSGIFDNIADAERCRDELLERTKSPFYKDDPSRVIIIKDTDPLPDGWCTNVLVEEDPSKLFEPQKWYVFENPCVSDYPLAEFDSYDEAEAFVQTKTEEDKIEGWYSSEYEIVSGGDIMK